MHRGAAQVVGGAAAPATHMSAELISALMIGDLDSVQRIVTEHPESVNSKDAVSMAQTIPCRCDRCCPWCVVLWCMVRSHHPSRSCGLRFGGTHHDVKRDIVSIVEMLVKAGADVNATDNVAVIFPVRSCAALRLCIQGAIPAHAPICSLAHVVRRTVGHPSTGLPTVTFVRLRWRSLERAPT
jgi:hypothetical protein